MAKLHGFSKKQTLDIYRKMFTSRRLDEKMLVEIRNQEEILNQSENAVEEIEDNIGYEPGVVDGDSGQTTLFGGEN